MVDQSVFVLYGSLLCFICFFFFFFQAEDGIRDKLVTGVQMCALPIFGNASAGVAGSFNPATPTGTNSTVTVTVGAAVTPGVYNLTVDGTGTPGNRSTPLTLTVSAAPDYALSVAPAALTIGQGANGSTTVTITRTNFSGAVTLSLGNAPTGVTGSFDPAAPTGTSSTLTVSVGPAVAPGVYNLTVNGTATAGNRSTPLTLTVGASGGGGNVTMVDAGYNRSCALTASGQAYCWGGLPTPVAGGLTFAALNMGDFHTCGVTTSGAAYCWGINDTAELGGGTTEDRSRPTPEE